MSSDDEEFFDEFDDDGIFWVEESEPTVADELAETTTYEATFLEDPTLETAEFFSDWEELSDDYYDEDPTVVRRLRAMGALSIKETADIDSPSTKRRKLVDDPATNMQSFQGIAWRQPANETDLVEIYTPGECEKVALLKNWREVFRNAKPAIARLRAQKADLKPSCNVLDGESELGLEPPSLLEDIGEDEVVASVTETAKPSYLTPIHAQVIVNSPSELCVHPTSGEVKNNIEDDAKHPLESTKEGQIPATQETATGASADKTAEVSTTATTTAPARRSRKRKAPVSSDENITGTSTQHKSKRAAPSNKSQPTTPPPVRRSARHM
ncbi:hypothetical protein BDW59DRAFT_149800, partial [Aspergillus cavernicola]